MSNQTIDGVPRERIQQIIADIERGGRLTAVEKLRALLDAPAVSLADEGEMPAAQPQGEPVAYDQAKENKLFEAWARTQSDVSLRLCDIGLYYQRDTGLAHDAWQYRAKIAEQPAPVAQKYDDTLLPFLALMRRELHANTGKGDREGWLGMSVESALCEIDHHAAKLKHAVHSANAGLIKEHAADVANCAMMLVDVCGALPE